MNKKSIFNPIVRSILIGTILLLLVISFLIKNKNSQLTDQYPFSFFNPNPYHNCSAFPQQCNDKFFLQTWGRIKNWGVINANAIKSHIDLLDAWKVTQGSDKTIVAVIDSGIDANHPDLAARLWRDPKEKTRPVFGWNFVTNQPNPLDDHGHGTHIAGIIAANFDAEWGVSGVAPNVQIMPIKYYSDANPGEVNLRNTIKSINYAIEHGAKVINYSNGGPEYSEEEYQAIKKAGEKGILFVAAAGNEHQNTDLVENYYYPAAYRLPNMISVAAMDINAVRIPTSNWGKSRVHVMAPGENIFSTLPGGRFGYMSGTSQATAFVSGVAALILSIDDQFTPKEIIEIIRLSVEKNPKMENLVNFGGQINAAKAVNVAMIYKKMKNEQSFLAPLFNFLPQMFLNPQACANKKQCLFTPLNAGNEDKFALPF